MASISIREWGSIGTEQVMRIDLSQPNGMSVSCINYGARLIRLLVPDREGQSENVVLGLADAEAYGNDQASFGATVGPVAGRIAEGKWGAVQLEQNNSAHHIHGGSRGWGQQFWGFTTEETAEAVSVTFSLESTPETVGYPGRLQAKISYTLDAEGCLTITMTGACSEETLFNPTSHIYFNLSGEAKRPITEHILQLACEEVLELDTDKLPTGKTRRRRDGFRFPRSDCYRRRHSKKAGRIRRRVPDALGRTKAVGPQRCGQWPGNGAVQQPQQHRVVFDDRHE